MTFSFRDDWSRSPLKFLTGIVTTMTLSCGVSGPLPAIRIPHIFDVLLSLQRLLSPDVISNETIPRHTFMCGVESEYETFMNMSPKIFFINCQVFMDIGQDGRSGSCANIVFPVILKRGHYYIIVGEESTPVYRVRNPRELFFSSKGTQVLRYLLSRNYCGKGKHIQLHLNKEGKQQAYCIPNFIEGNQCPTERYTECNNATIEKQLMFPLVDAPTVPPHCKLSVQIINLNDTENIVDIY